jgi:shikimate kinase
VHVVLIGLMGSGKSTVGRLLAARLDRPFLDNDDMLERRTGLRARDISAAEGVEALHRAEASVLADALSGFQPAVIAAAAAAPLERDAGFAPHVVVYLHAGTDVLARRLRAANDDHRPLLAGDIDALLRTQYDARDAVYRGLADVVVDATQPAARVVDAVMQALGAGQT